MRLFIAVELSGKTREALSSAVDELRPALGRLSWESAENMHITVKFLGEVEANQIASIDGALYESVRELAPFEFAVEGLGAFPHPERARVLWAGIRESNAEFARLHKLVDEAMSGLGFAREQRRFSPHVTLARIRRPLPSGLVQAAIGRFQGRLFGEEQSEEIVLMQSTLGREGAVYTPLARHTFV